MPDYATFRRAGVTFPLTAATTNSLLRDADPTLYYALDFFAAVLELHIGTRLIAQAVVAGQADITAAVIAKVPLDPAPLLTEEQFKFPLLAVYRRRATVSDRTRQWRHERHEVGVEYILPPLTGGQAEHLVPILHAVGVVIDRMTEQGYDPNYSAGLKVWAAAQGAVEKIELTSSEFGVYPGLNGQTFYSWRGVLEVHERDELPAGAFDDFAGADIHINLKDAATDSTVDDLTRPYTYPAPTITTVSPATGLAAGATAITITGTNFVVGAQPTVTIGAARCTAVVVASATSITAVTPAGAVGTHDLTVTLLDGQSATLEDAFTYT